MNRPTFKLNETEVNLMMQKLQISREEAIQLLEDDYNDVTEELTPEQQRVAQSMMRADTKAGIVRKRKMKVNEVRRFIMQEFANCVSQFVEDPSQVEITNSEREMTFVYQNETYKIVLSKPREKKD